MDILEIGDIIAHIDLRTLIVRTQPYNIHSKISNVVEFRDDARDVAVSGAKHKGRSHNR
jgi:hypothetical protein